MNDSKVDARPGAEAVTAGLDAIVQVLRDVSKELTNAELRWKPAAEEFSVLELICHLRDIELEGYSARIRRLLDEDEPFLPDVDGTKVARDRDYNSENVGAALGSFAKAREANLRILSALSDRALSRAGMLEGVGPITIAELIEKMKEHDQGHHAEALKLKAALRSHR